MTPVRTRRLALQPLAALTLSALACWPAAQAQTPSPSVDSSAGAARADIGLGPVVVTGQRGANTSMVVQSKRIEVQQATGVQELFKLMPELDVGGGPSVAQKVYVRGINERMLTVTIDGASQPEAAYHHSGQLMIEPELLKRVEVEAGTGAATAGPGALGGALRFTTKDASDLLRPGERVGALLKAGYQSVNDGRALSATVFGRPSEQTELLVSVSDRDSDSYQDGHGRTVPNSSTEARNIFLKFGAQAEGGHRFKLSHEDQHDDALRNKRTNLLVTADPKLNPAQRQLVERKSTVASWDYQPGNPLVKANITAYMNDNGIRLAKGQPNSQTLGIRSAGLNAGNTSILGDHRLAYGVNVRRDTGYAGDRTSRMDNEVAHVAGVYLQDEYAFAERWSLGLGARYDRYSYEDTAHQRFTSKGFSPNASLSFSPSDAWTVQLSHARALRGVGVIEPFLRSANNGNAADLDPEKARHTELSARWRDGGWHAAAAVFRQSIDNVLDYGETNRINVGELRVRGYSGSFGYRGTQWSASLGVAESRPELNGEPIYDTDALLLGTSSGRTWVAQLDYALPQWHLNLGWTARAVQRLKRVPEGGAEKPGYHTHDIYAQWQPTGKDDWTVTLTVANLFDRFYYDHSTYGFHPRWGRIAGLPEPGRDIRLALSWRL
ncbi:TonB-dependent receptor domain-containing protein [Eleftheria terrae]|uniref:TonB-dependent receptor domain-containing protein n=1 Tax=Eleftheria terrae TaxID=1597781 RepID=UPI00263B04B6|nr:TonB-dependent receptor [Eleftheria terrae]WKB55525.1 TonB-dependent receptor [Eleftheria terrae]